MSWPGNYGRLWGQIPSTAGQVFWVSPSDSYTVNGLSYSASDNHDGLAPDRALRTINQAWDLVTASAGDVIVLLPGTHSGGDGAGTASVTADVAGVTMMGLPSGTGNWLYPKTVIGAVTGDQTVNVTAADIEIAHLRIVPVTADTAVDVNAGRLYIHDCQFDLFTAAVNTATIGLESLGTGSANALVERCVFLSDGAQGPGITGTMVGWRVDNCYWHLLAGTWAVGVAVGASSTNTLFTRCHMIDYAGTITVGVDGALADQANGVAFADCRFGAGVTTPLDNFGAAEATLAENYKMGVGACDGGTIIDAIT